MLFFVGLMGMLWFGWRVFPPLLYSSTEQPFQFSHAVHSGEAAGMSCADCHPFRDDGSFVGLPPLSVCLDCHEEAIGETRQERIFIEKYVTPRKEVPWLVYSRQPMNAYFSHAAHVTTAKFTCEECHGEHGTSESIPPYQVNRISGYSRAIGGASSAGRAVLPTEVMRMDTCANCHVKHGRNSPCLECHK
jgi:hypothetical protein